jgi:Regulator of chromosome condensation (RCC1) repeat
VNTYYPSPVLISGLSNITQIIPKFVGGEGAFARDSSGRIFEWGKSKLLFITASGYTGDPLNPNTPASIALNPPSGQIVCENDPFVFNPLSGSSQPVLWSFTAPKLIAELSNITKLVANPSGAFFALTPEGAVYAWGKGDYGVLANGETIDSSTGVFTTTFVFHFPLGSLDIANPKLIQGLTGVRDIVAASDMTYALMRDGSIKAWGSDTSRHMGNVKSDSKLRPTTIPGADNIRTLHLLPYYLDADDLVMTTYDGQIRVWIGFEPRNRRNFGPAERRLFLPPSPVRAVEILNVGQYYYRFSATAFMNSGQIREYSIDSNSFSGDISAQFLR